MNVMDPPHVSYPWQGFSSHDTTNKTSVEISPEDEDFEMVCAGGVVKRVVQEGTGDVVPLHATCLVHYVGRIVSNGAIFVDTTQGENPGPVQMIAGRDAIVKEQGIHKVVATMRVGEVCHAWVTPEFGYGAKGNFSFPSIPPNAHLSYAVELVDFEAPREISSSLTYEERVEAAVRRRMQGNACFTQGNVEAAMSSYTSGLAFLDDDFIMQLYEFHYDRAMEEKVLLLVNLAACYLNQESYHEVLRTTNEVLAVDSKNMKALFRRGIARRKLGQTAEALDDLELAKKMSTSGVDARILKEIAAAKRDIREQRKAQGSLYKAMMDSSLSVPPAQDMDVALDRDIHVLDDDVPISHDAHPSWYRTSNLFEWLCPWFGVSKKQKAT